VATDVTRGEADLDAPLFVRSGWSYMTADDYAYSIDTASAAAGVRANDSVRQQLLAASNL